MNIQTVTGLIRRSSVMKSHKWSTLSQKAGRSDRSTGIYAEKAWDGNINVRFNLNNYSEANMKMVDVELAEFERFAKTQGYTLTQESRWTFKIEAA